LGEEVRVPPYDYLWLEKWPTVAMVGRGSVGEPGVYDVTNSKLGRKCGSPSGNHTKRARPIGKNVDEGERRV